MRPFRHVFLLGFDGAGNAVREVETPNVQRVFDRGAWTCHARTALPSISGECWGTMLHCVEPRLHGLTNDRANAGHFPPDSPYPSVFRLLREQVPGAQMASFCEWQAIHYGIIEQNLGCRFVTMWDDALAQQAADYLAENEPDLFFLELSGCDAAGHRDVYWTGPYYEAVRESDRCLGIVLDAVERRGWWDDSLILVTTDHGAGLCRGYGAYDRVGTRPVHPGLLGPENPGRADGGKRELAQIEEKQ